MKQTPTVTAVDTFVFYYDLEDVGGEPLTGSPVSEPGSTRRMQQGAVRVHTDAGVTGEYVGGSVTDRLRRSARRPRPGRDLRSGLHHQPHDGHQLVGRCNVTSTRTEVCLDFHFSRVREKNER